jgi:hypothetical protein
MVGSPLFQFAIEHSGRTALSHAAPEFASGYDTPITTPVVQSSREIRRAREESSLKKGRQILFPPESIEGQWQ